MRIKRDLAIEILKYLYKHPRFYFPFLVISKIRNGENDDFIEIEPDEWKLMQKDEAYQTFELRENLQNLYKGTTELLAKWFLQKITKKSLNEEIKCLAKQYRALYKKELCESEKIEEYWENEFVWWKAETYEDILELLEKYKN